MKSAALLVLLLGVTHALSVAAAAPRDPTTALRDVAVRIRQASDATARGRAASARDVAGLEHALRSLDALAGSSPDAAFATKRRAVELSLDKLKFDLSHAPATASVTAQDARARIDREIIGARHGDACTAALGISPELPVEVTLAAAAQPGSESWFRLEPSLTATYIFRTRSSGADPALEIFHDCGGTALSRNDDAIGLDAQASAGATAHQPLLVHVTNSGAGGAVLLDVAAADATIAGKVTDSASGQGLMFPQIVLFASNGNYVYSNANVDANGNYSVAVAAGSYYVRATAALHVDGLYPHAQCGLTNYYFSIDHCATQNAVLVVASSGATTAGTDIQLDLGRRIAGTVRDPSGQPLPNATISLNNVGGNGGTSTTADQFGRYQLSTLPSDTYHALASANGYGSQLYDHVACGGPLLTDCDLNQGTPLTISSQDLLGIDFNLPRLATIHGTVHNLPATANATITVVSLGGSYVAQGYTDQQGNYSVGPLTVGQFYVFASSQGYFSQIFPGIDCGQDCVASLDSATRIAITQQGQSPAADFTLSPLPVQHGHVQDAATGLPLGNVNVYASILPPASFYAQSYTTTNANGDFSLTGTPAGSYYIWAQSSDHIDQVYPGIPCEQTFNYYYTSPTACDVTGAVLMTIAPQIASLPDMNFALPPSSSIAGHVAVRGAGGPTVAATNVSVFAYDVSGVQVASANVDALGNYRLNDLDAGTYFVTASGYNSVFELWQNIDCPGSCAPTQGTPLPVAANTSVGGIDFSLVRRDAIVGQVTDALNVPLPNVLVDLFDAITLGYVATGATDSQGYYLASGSTGHAYFVATEAGGSYINQVYAGVSCPLGPAYLQLCPFTNATPISLTNASSQPHVVNFALSMPPDEIFAGNFE